jgi:large conductance mechanosensitive channel
MFLKLPLVSCTLTLAIDAALTACRFAASFTACANSLVTDMILPLVSLLPFLDRNIEQKFLILRAGDSKPAEYNTIDQALEDGALIWAWGSFVDKILRFFLIALALFTISRIYSVLAHDNIIKRQIRCKYCRKWISEKSKRCFNCTSWQDGREDPKGVAPPVEDDDD